MKNALKNFAAVAALFTVAVGAHAECGQTGCSGLVEKIYSHVQSNGFTYVQIAGTRSNVTICTKYSDVYFGLPGDQPGSKQVLATLLAAQATGRTINVRVDKANPADNPSPCNIVYVVLEP